MKEVLSVAKALSDENRLRILMMLSEAEACVCQIIELIGIAPSTVSKHLAILRGAGFIDSYKQGRWIYYHLERSPSAAVRGALDWTVDCLQDHEAIRDDRQKGRTICQQDPELLARAQRER